MKATGDRVVRGGFGMPWEPAGDKGETEDAEGEMIETNSNIALPESETLHQSSLGCALLLTTGGRSSLTNQTKNQLLGRIRQSISLGGKKSFLFHFTFNLKNVKNTWFSSHSIHYHATLGLPSVPNVNKYKESPLH